MAANKAVWYDGPLGLARNSYRTEGSTVIMKLTRGLECRVGVADFELLREIRWCPHRTKKGYETFNVNGWTSPVKSELLHRFLLAAPVGEEVDHADRDPLNNLRTNLRLSDRAGQSRNRGSWSVIGFKGVTRKGDRYRARIRLAGKDKILGLFTAPEEAARAYDAAAREAFGTFAATNEALGLLPTLLVLPVPEPMAAD